MFATERAVNLDAVRELPAIPQTLQDLLETLADEYADRKRIIFEVSRDLGLSCKLMRIANSSFYGLSYHVASIHDAVLILGLRTLRSLATATLMSSQLQTWSGKRSELTHFFEHALSSAVYAQLLAEHVGANRDNAFTAGLLHDIGKLILVSEHPESGQSIFGQEIEWQAQSNPLDPDNHDLAHAELGRQVLQYWHFPLDMQQAVAAHHLPFTNESSELTCLVMVANLFADQSKTKAERMQSLLNMPLLWQSLALNELLVMDILERGHSYFHELLMIFAEHQHGGA